MNESPLPRALLLVILLAALWLRAVHVDFGLPSFYHPDETRSIGEVRHLLEGGYELHHYEWPPLLRNLAFAALKIVQIVSGRTGTVPPPATILLALRLMSVLSGVGAVAALFWLASRFVTRSLALVAAGLYAILPLTVISSKYGTPDTLLCLLFTLSLAVQIDLLERPSPRVYALVGLLASLAVGAKYNGAFLLVSAVVAHWLSRRASAPTPFPLGRSVAAGLAGAGAGVAVSFPFLFLEWRDLAHGIRGEIEHLFVRGHGGFTVSGGKAGYYVYHLVHSVLPACGPILLAAIVVGLVLMVMRHGRRDCVLLAAVVPYYIVMETIYLVPPRPERYALPLLGPFLVAAVIACARLGDLIGTRFPGSRVTRASKGGAPPTPLEHPRKSVFLGVAGTLALAAVLGIWPAVKTAAVISGLVPDTRDSMKSWMVSSLPAGATIWIEPLGPYYPDLSTTEFRQQHVIKAESWEELGVPGNYVLASSLVYDRYAENPEQRPPRTRFYERLFAEGRLVHEESNVGAQYLFHNPVLKLYSVPPIPGGG